MRKLKKNIKIILLQETTCQLYKEYLKMALELYKKEFTNIWASVFLSSMCVFWKVIHTREIKKCLMSATLSTVILLSILDNYKVISYYFSRAADFNLISFFFFPLQAVSACSFVLMQFFFGQEGGLHGSQRFCNFLYFYAHLDISQPSSREIISGQLVLMDILIINNKIKRKCTEEAFQKLGLKEVIIILYHRTGTNSQYNIIFTRTAT